jgi:hypothetical protein
MQFLGISEEGAPVEYFRSTKIHSSYNSNAGKGVKGKSASEIWDCWTSAQKEVFRRVAGNIELETPEEADSEYCALIQRIRQVVQTIVPTGAKILVAGKGDPELLELAGRAAGHFPQRSDGQYVGFYPANSAAAIDHVADLRRAGWEYLLFPSTAFWWLHHYSELGKCLDENLGIKRYQDDDCVVYSLSAK